MVPNNALQRTFRMQFGDSTGTCFTVDVEGKQYIVTARHVLENIREGAEIQLYHNGTWSNLSCRVVGVSEGEIDIAVLAPPHPISPSHPLEPTTKDLCLSQDAYFLGFPYGLHAEIGDLNSNFPLPLVKKGCVSLLALTPGEPKYVLLDGHNNPGFSGGPVVFAPHGQSIATRVLGVVSGFKFVWDQVFANETETPLAIKYNTGIVIAYAIDYAIELIVANPIGPAVGKQDA